MALMVGVELRLGQATMLFVMCRGSSVICVGHAA